MSDLGFSTRIQEMTGKQMLAYCWYGEDSKHLMLEYAVGGIGSVTDAETIALELEQLAEAIRRKNREHRLPRKRNKIITP